MCMAESLYSEHCFRTLITTQLINYTLIQNKNKHFDNQHNAMADVEATYECYKELLRLGIYR